MLSLREYKAVFDAAPDGCLIVGVDGNIEDANPKVQALFGWRVDDLLGQPVETLLPDALRASHVGQREGFTRNPHDRPMGAGLELRGCRRDGTTFPVEVSLSTWQPEGEKLRVICSVRDVTAYHRLRNFSEGALRATEEERRRIARELHDDTAQRLATLILRVRMLAEQPEAGVRARLNMDVRAEIVEALDGVKRISRGLLPRELEHLGLVFALRAHVRDLHESGVFQVDTDLGEVDPYLDMTAKLALYRIIQEALSNARRHSGATSARVGLVFEEGAVVAEIQDDGSGFDLGWGDDGHRGLGLVGMQERATMIGGRITVDSAPGEGTRVRVVVPVRTESENG